MPPAIASLEDAILGAYLGTSGWPRGLLSTLKLELCCDILRHCRPNPEIPKLLLGTGFNTTRLFYSATAQHLASVGFEVIVMDHPYETDVVQFPSGEIVYGGRIGRGPEDDDAKARGLDVRTRDATFVMDHFGIQRVVYAGQSFGGAAAAAAILSEPRILGGINLDGELWGPARKLAVSRPFLIMGAEGHNTTSLPGWGEFAKAMEKSHSDAWFKLLNVKDTVHGSFLDFSLIGDLNGLRTRKELEGFFGKATGRRVMEILTEYTADFVQYVWCGGDEGLLRGPSSRFPDVSFLS